MQSYLVYGGRPFNGTAMALNILGGANRYQTRNNIATTQTGLHRSAQLNYSSTFKALPGQSIRLRKTW